MQESLENKDHFLYHIVNRLFDWDSPEYVKNNIENGKLSSNVNLSNLGKYPFSPVYKADGYDDIILDKIYAYGNDWIPNIMGYSILVHSIDHFCYTLLCEE